MEEHERQQIIALVKREVVPAIGCTEPMAVALCVARATETLGKRPEKITAQLSANILKNAMGVGIPGTGMIGLPIAIALGALIGKSAYQLEVLKDFAERYYEGLKKQKYKGGVELFGIPSVRFGMVMDLKSMITPEMDGKYFIEKVTKTFSDNATYRQKVELGGRAE